MAEFIRENWLTAVILIILALCVFLAIRKIVRDRKAGIGPCGQKCENCPKMQGGECDYRDKE